MQPVDVQRVFTPYAEQEIVREGECITSVVTTISGKPFLALYEGKLCAGTLTVTLTKNGVAVTVDALFQAMLAAEKLTQKSELQKTYDAAVLYATEKNQSVWRQEQEKHLTSSCLSSSSSSGKEEVVDKSESVKGDCSSSGSKNEVSVSSKEEAKSITTGLVNLDNSCWMNALLQLIRDNKSFQTICESEIQFFSHESEEDRLALFDSLAKLQELLADHVRSSKPISKEVLQEIRFWLEACGIVKQANKIQDATEVLTKLLARFPGKIEKVITRQAKYTDGEKSVANGVESDFLAAFITRAKTTLQEVFGSYFALYQPDGFSHFVQQELVGLPYLLQLRVNRVGDGSVEMAEQVDLSGYFPADKRRNNTTHLYEVDSVICHSGGNTNESGGHYYYYSRVASDTWVKYDDSSVSNPMTFQEAKKELDTTAYALFLRKK